MLKSGWKRTQITWKTHTFTIPASSETVVVILKACILNDLYQQSQSIKSKGRSSSFHGVFWNVTYLDHATIWLTVTLLLLARSIQRHTFVSQDGRRITEAGLYLKRPSWYTRGVQGQYEALQDVLRNSLVLATADLQRTLQAFCESKRHVNTMVNSLHVIKEHLRKIQEKILTPLC